MHVSVRARRAVVGGVAAVVVLAMLPVAALAAAYDATASISPTTAAQGTLTTFTVTVNNTGSSTTIGAVEVRRPDNRWLVTACLSSPAGWGVMTSSDTMCRFKSGSGTADDIQPAGSAQFTFIAMAMSTGVTYPGTFKVTVSNLNTFAKPARMRAAAAAPPGLTVTATAPVDTAPSVTTTSPTDAATDVSVSTNIVVNFSESVSATTSSFTLECPTGTAEGFGVSGSPGTAITLDPTSDLPEGEVCSVKVVANQISDSDAVDPPDNMAADYDFSFTTGINNDAPTDISLSNNSIAENQPTGTDIGTLTTTDPEAGDSHSYTLESAGCGGGPFADNGSFQIGGINSDVLQSGAIFDFETDPSYTVCVRTTDQGSLSFDKQFTISVTDANDAPSGVADSAQTVPNVQLFYDVATGGAPGTTKTTVSGKGVLDNDTDADGNNLSVTGIVSCGDVTAPFDCATTGGGAITMDATGHFTYRPVAGSTTADSFQYVLTDDGTPPLSTNVSVNLTFVGNRIWFVQNNAAAGGTGRSNDPFDTLPEAQTAANAANDVVFVYAGDGTTANQNTGFTMQAAGQRLQGQAVALTTGTTVNGTLNGQLVAAGSRPLIDNTTPGGEGVLMSIGSTVMGLSVAGAGDAIAFGSNGAAGGSYNVDNNVIRDAAAYGILVSVGSSATGTVNFKITNNVFSGTGTFPFAAIGAHGDGTNTLTIAILNNTITTDAFAGIAVEARGNGTVNATVTGNAINLTSLSDQFGILMESGSISGDTATLCAQIGGPSALVNNVSTAGTVFPDIRLNQQFSTTFRLPGYGGSATDDSAVANFVLAQNTATGGALASHDSGFAGGGSPCPTPP